MSEYNNITIEMENGSKVEYEVLAVFEVEGSSYVALLPHDNSNNITFYGCTELEDTHELELSVIDDEIEFGVVSNAFIEIMEDYSKNGME